MAQSQSNAGEVKRATDIVAVIQQDGVSLKRSGTEFLGLCPFHADTKASLKVNERKQIFACFACGHSGDVFDYLHQRHGYTLPEAISFLSGKSWQVDTAAIGKANYSRPSSASNWEQLPEAPEPCSDFVHYKHGTPAAKWAYLTTTGRLIGYVCRFNLPDGTKDVIPRVWGTDGNRTEWRWMGFKRPRPLYGLKELADKPTATVIVVEGEKTADAARLLFPKMAVVSWPGGSKAVQHADWTPLQGRKVILSPDNDTPGVSAMIAIAGLLSTIAASVRWLPPPESAGKGWDWADWQDSPAEAREFARSAVTQPPAMAEVKEAKPAKEPPPAVPTSPPKDMEEHFRILGFEKTESGTLAYYFYVRSSLKVLRYTATALSKSNLMTLAPLQWWEGHFPGRQGLSVDMAVNWIIASGNKRGIFDDACMRGRGAWMDGDTPVVHAGDRLYVNGNTVPLNEWDSPYFYEQMGSLGLLPVDPLPTTEAVQVINLVKQLSFERELSAYLLAGWCVIAPVCGALTWRPHIWLTGGAGTGKTWTFKNIVCRLLGKFGVAVQSATTSSYIRQKLQSDALPVVFDEAESNTRSASDRINELLELVRSASAGDGGVIGKGSAMGAAKTYQMRSCFAFASIVVGAESQADQSRITVLVFKSNNRPDKQEWWQRFKTEYFRVVTPEFVERLQARTVRLLPVILKNAQTFADAAASLLGDQRTGDQLGAMLAGAYSLHSTKEISFDDAVAWMKSRDWTEEKNLEAQRDETKLLEHILEHKERISTSGVMQERTIGELIAIAAKHLIDPVILEGTADANLRRLGIKIDDGGFVIGHGTAWLQQVLRGTPWERNPHVLLKRLPGTEEKAATYFCAGMKKRGTWFPFTLLAEDAPEPVEVPDDLPF